MYMYVTLSAFQTVSDSVFLAVYRNVCFDSECKDTVTVNNIHKQRYDLQLLLKLNLKQLYLVIISGEINYIR